MAVGTEGRGGSKGFSEKGRAPRRIGGCWCRGGGVQMDDSNESKERKHTAQAHA